MAVLRRCHVYATRHACHIQVHKTTTTSFLRRRRRRVLTILLRMLLAGTGIHAHLVQMVLRQEPHIHIRVVAGTGLQPRLGLVRMYTYMQGQGGGAHMHLTPTPLRTSLLLLTRHIKVHAKVWVRPVLKLGPHVRVNRSCTNPSRRNTRAHTTKKHVLCAFHSWRRPPTR